MSDKKLSKEELVKAVRAHALSNYDVDGWDYVVETFDDSDIIEDMGDATTAAEAIENVAYWCSALQELLFEAQVASGEREAYPKAFAYFEKD